MYEGALKAAEAVENRRTASIIFRTGKAFWKALRLSFCRVMRYW